jgi:hypothetical protein
MTEGTEEFLEKIIEDAMIKHQVKCNDCGLVYFLEDAQYCIHKTTLGIGTKECPQCHNCICHGETADQIQERFRSNLAKGKFVPVEKGKGCEDWEFQCKTIQEVEV